MSWTEHKDFCRQITEKASIACFDYIGKQDGKAADQAATSQMRDDFKKIPIDGTIVIGEGERDEAPMLFIGEKVGQGSGSPLVDIAVDPLEGTGLCARGEAGSLCVLAFAEHQSLLHAPDVYMDKLACGKQGQGLLSIQNSVQKNIQILSETLNKKPSELKVACLDRPRHQKLILELKEAGVSPLLFGDGDVAMSILTCIDSPDSIDLLLGSGGAPEGVLSAIALKSLGGDFQGQLLWEGKEDQKKRAISMGLKDVNQVFKLNDLAQGQGVFCATGVTTGPLVKGVQKTEQGFKTWTLILSTLEKKYEVVETEHSL